MQHRKVKLTYTHKAIALLLAILLLATALISGTMAWREVSQHRTNELSGTHDSDTPTPPDRGELMVTKTVVNPSGALTPEQLAQEFQFTVTLVGIPNSPIIVNLAGVDTLKQIVNEQVTFNLRHGESAIIQNIPVGTQFTVTEAQLPGFVISSVNHQGTVPLEGITAAFTNTIIPPNTGSLRVTKEVRGNNYSTTDFDFNVQFTFPQGVSLPLTVTVNGAEYVLTSSSTSFTLRHDDEWIIAGLPVDTQFTVTETPHTDYMATVVQYTGEIAVSGVVVHTPFVNVYDYDQDESGNLVISKTVPGGSDTEFEFTLTLTFPEDTVFPIDIVVNGQIVTVHGNGNVSGVGGGEQAADSNDDGDESVDINDANDDILDEAINDESNETDANDYAEYDLILASAFASNINITPFGARYVFVYSYPFFTLRDGDSLTVQGLPHGTEWHIVERPAIGYRPTIIEAGGIIVGADPTITIPVNFVNYPEPDDEFGDLTLSKIVTNGGESRETIFDFVITFNIPSQVQLPITIIFDGEYEAVTSHTHPLIAHLMHNESVTIENLPVGTTYTIIEINIPTEYTLVSVVDGHGTIVSGNSTAIFTNRFSREYVTVEINGTKTWYNPNNAPLPSSIIVQLMHANVVVDYTIVTPDSYGNWTFSFTAPRYYSNGIEIQYHVREVPIPGWEASYSYYGYDILNTYVPHVPVYIEVTVTKEWNDNNNPNRPTSVLVQLFRNGEAYGSPVTLYGGNEWTYTWTYLDDIYTWTVDELNVPAGYTATITGSVTNGFVITNTYCDDPDPNLIDVRVAKIWNDGNYVNRPSSVQVQLFRNGVAYGTPITLNTGNGWEHEWANLDGEQTWTVDELYVPEGYIATITGNVTNGFVITNTLESITPLETITLEGRKYWNHLNNPVQYRPTSITIFIYANGQRLKSFLLTEDCQWQFSFELPRYDANGNEIVYTINEARVYDYTKRIEGWNIHNRFHPGTDTDQPYILYDPRHSPQTGDRSRIAFWLVVMGMSMVGMIATISAGIKHKQRLVLAGNNEYEGKYLN